MERTMALVVEMPVVAVVGDMPVVGEVAAMPVVPVVPVVGEVAAMPVVPVVPVVGEVAAMPVVVVASGGVADFMRFLVLAMSFCVCVDSRKSFRRVQGFPRILKFRYFGNRFKKNKKVKW